MAGTKQKSALLALLWSLMIVAQAQEPVPGGATPGGVTPELLDDPAAEPDAEVFEAPAYVVPPVRERPLAVEAGPRVTVSRFRVTGVGEWPELGVDPAAAQAVADAALSTLAGGPGAAGSAPADPSQARYPQEVYQIFGRALDGVGGDRSLSELAVLYPPEGPGRELDMVGLTAAQRELLDNELDAAWSAMVGAEPHDPMTLNDLVRRTVSQPSDSGLTVGQMQEVADEVALWLRARDLFLAQAFIPAQDVGPDNVVELRVLEGRLGAVVAEGNQRYSQKVLARHSRALQGRPLTQTEVEQVLLKVNDYPGVQVFGTFRPGAEVGSSDLVLQVRGEDPMQWELGLDNFGTEFTGELRSRASGVINNPLGQADRLSISAVQSISPANNTFGRIDYRIPLGATDLSATLGGSVNDFAIDEGRFAVLDVQGETVTARFDLDWQLLRSRFLTTGIGLQLAHAQSELTNGDGSIVINDDTIEKLSLSWTLEQVDTRFNGINLLNLLVAGGRHELLDPSEPDGERSFSLYRLDFSRLQLLPRGQSLLLRARAQFATETLSSLERLSLAGPDAVRAYPVSEILTDEAYLASVEYRINGPQRPGPFQQPWNRLLRFALFVDYASGTFVDSDFDEDLIGAGGSVKFGLPGRFDSSLQVSTPLSDFEPSDGEDLRLYGELKVYF